MGFSQKLKSSLRPFYANNKHFLYKSILPLRNFNVEESIIISSETRSGTTWLMDLIVANPNLIINWEPLHEIKGVVPQELNWGERPYVKEDSTDIEAKKLISEILGFRRISKNSVKYCRLTDMFSGKQVLTKMVRSNLLLPFIVENFNLKHKPIYLLRHPIAVSLSQLKNIPESQKEIKDYEVPETFNNERYKENFEYLNSLSTLLERQVALWCIHNMDIINHPMNGKKWATVFYEKLLLDPANELEKLGKEINFHIPIDEKLFKKASESDFFNTFQRDTQVQLSKWKKNLRPEELINLQKIFDHYNLTIYNASNPEPII